jgi:2-(1,2-epoxy-1,2-dihydrophenyl)acetyl-CoA isomerase
MNKQSDNVLYEERGAVALITLNRPAALNTFNEGFGHEILKSLDRAQTSAAVRAVVLTGAGRGFSAGAELKPPFPSVATMVARLEEEYAPGILAIAAMPKPVIAAVNGFATGIGASYALACDLLLIEASAFLQSPFARIGLVPDGGLCWQLATRLGPRLAFELACSGERVAAQRCVELGLANRMVADGKVVEEALAMAEKLAEAAPLALAGTKRLLRSAAELGLAATLREETLEQAQRLASADFSEGVAAFLEKRKPKFSGC